VLTSGDVAPLIGEPSNQVSDPGDVVSLPIVAYDTPGSILT
jgi:hypothetical protein